MRNLGVKVVKFIKVFSIVILYHGLALGQKNDVWIRYHDKAKNLYGYKDLKGKIKIPAKFSNFFTQADSFYNIISVKEETLHDYKTYYLLKNGKKVGLDSLYILDYAVDCESEGKIRFQNKKNDRIGFLDKNGKAVIPAIYNYATPFYNGVSRALINAKRTCWDEKEDTLNCEHLAWKGGIKVLINDKNEILADSLHNLPDNINWYSLKTNQADLDTSIWFTIKGKNGNTYSFIDYQKEFRHWFETKFLSALKSSNLENLKRLFFSGLQIESEKLGTSNPRQKNFNTFVRKIVTPERFQANAVKEIHIMNVDLMFMNSEKPIYKKYFDACGRHQKEKFPTFLITIDYYRKRKEPLILKSFPQVDANWKPSEFDINFELDYQERFEFLRTSNGYKLVDVEVKN
ncbi:WG repeat-containing protein [Flectobacillus roseus]